MPGPAPKLERRRRNAPKAGEWKAAPATGWQHGTTPKPPKGLTAESRRQWKEWFASWAASFWRPDHISGLRTAILLYNEMQSRPSASTASTLGQYLDRYGLTPKGQQDRRWLPPKDEERPEAEKPTSAYRKLRVVNE